MEGVREIKEARFIGLFLKLFYNLEKAYFIFLYENELNFGCVGLEMSSSSGVALLTLVKLKGTGLRNNNECSFI